MSNSNSNSNPTPRSALPQPAYSVSPSAIPTSANGRTTPSLSRNSALAPRSTTPSAILPPRNSLAISNSHLPPRPASASFSRRDSLPTPSHLIQTAPGSPSLALSFASPASRSATPLPHPSPALSSPDQALNLPIASNSTSVQVLLRIRPASFDANVPARFQRIVVTPLNSTTVSVESVPAPSAGASAPSSVSPAAAQPSKPAQRFTFDRVYAPEEGQRSMWSSVEGLISRFLEGYNVTVFAYGQTSSGKSYTMGTDRFSAEDLADIDSDHSTHVLDSERTGIIPRAVHTIFSKINQQSSKSNQITVKTSYVEIYNEDLIDLIASSQSPASVLPQVTIREDKDGNIIWSGLKEVKVSKSSEALKLLEQGSLVRQTNSTEMNAQSSRSHAIFSISLTQRKLATPALAPKRAASSRVASPTPSGRDTPTQALDSEWVTVTSKFHFVDLAGSERLKRTAAVGERIKEGISINSGLHALGNVISALGDPSKAKTVTHIPYRDSKLTRLLQDSLGGNAHTLMIACVSPSEYNLNETLNTLKYANRARNIKNRAQVNAVEAGWDDVDYLQATVLKLRKELANLKATSSMSELASSSRTLSCIDEEAPNSDGRGLKYIDVAGHLTELQAKYAKALSDLAQAQNGLDQATQSGTPAISHSAFENMIQPIVEEYEKSITALESQLALTKAALGHSEQSMKELEEKLAHELMLNESQANMVADLKSRLTRLIEREADNESYIKGLEHKLKTLTDTDEGSAALISELQKELSKLRDQDTKSEMYIKDLEHRLSKDGQTSLVERISFLEAELTAREESYEALQERFSALNSHLAASSIDLLEQQRELSKELADKEDRLVQLQATIEQFETEKAEIEAERRKLELDTLEANQDNVQLRAHIQALESSSKPVGLSAEHTNMSDHHSHVSLSPRSFTPPATPAGISCSPIKSSGKSKSAPDQALQSQFQELQERYSATVGELDLVRAKYKSSLKELEELSVQLDESRLMQPSNWVQRRSLTGPIGYVRSSGSNYGSPSHSPVPQSPSQSHAPNMFPNNNALPVRGFGTPLNSSARGYNNRMSTGEVGQGGNDEGEESLETLNTEHDTERARREVSPSRRMSNGSATGRDIWMRRSIPINNGSTVSGRAMGRTGSSAGRSLSLSLSQDGGFGSRAVVLNTARASSSSRSTSPIHTRGIMAGGSSEQLSPYSAERSYESLEKEVLKLQEVLKEREEEIRSLELSIREVHRRSAATESSSNRTGGGGGGDEMATQGRQTEHEGGRSRVGEDLDGQGSAQSPVYKDRNSLEAGSDGALDVINYHLALHAGEEGNGEESKNIKRLDDLMRSMAQKESSHLELIDGLKDQLDTKKKAHDELVKLSRDQVENMSAEIEALRAKLGQMETGEEEMRGQLEEMEQVLMAKEAELEKVKMEVRGMILETEASLEKKQAEIEALKAAHLEDMERLKEEQRENLDRLVAASSAEVSGKQAELERLEREWGARLEAGLRSQAEQMGAEAEAAQQLVVERQSAARAEALEAQQRQFEAETQKLFEHHMGEVERLQSQIRESVAMAEAGAAATVKEVEVVHARELADESGGDEDVVARQAVKLEAVRTQSGAELEALKRELAETEQRLIAAHRQEMQALETEHEGQMNELKAEHEEILVASLTELDLRRTRKFEASLQAIQQKHLEQVEEIKKEHGREVERIVDQFQERIGELSQGREKGGKEREEGEEDSTVIGRSKIQKIQEGYEEKINELKEIHQNEILKLEVKYLGSNLSNELEAERKSNLRKIERLEEELNGFKQDRDEQKHGVDRDMGGASEAEVELQEALDALSTLDKALLESQAERERLLKQLSEQKRMGMEEHENLAREVGNLQGELGRLKAERDELARERERERSGEHEVLGRPPGGGLRAESPSMPGLPQRNRLLSSTKPPPPTPPPSMPPPPLPTSLPGLPAGSSSSSGAGTVKRPTRTSNSSSQLSHTNNSQSGRESPSTSVGTNSLIDSISLDPRVLKKIEEQESAISKLSKQLSHCETDLKANIDLVGNLESALNDTERNLRKSRLQMNELAKERDKLTSQNETLRRELSKASEEVEKVRNNVLAEKVEFENILGEERRAKESAKKLLESRMEEIQRDTRGGRKSKFNCF